MSSIIVYIRSMLSLNLTKYKLLYCSKKSTSIISCYYNFTTIADEKKKTQSNDCVFSILSIQIIYRNSVLRGR